jgi:outer membrane autotransporter protein
MVLTPRVSAAWQHAFGPAAPTEALAFASTGVPFTVAGLPIARDTALLEGGLDVQINPRARLGVSYSSELGSHAQRDAVQGSLTWQF